MKQNLLDYLACPSCGASINLKAVAQEDGLGILSGELQCTACPRTFAIRRGVPGFANLAEIGAGKQATAENFGWSWQEFSHEDEKYGDELLGWLAPVRPEFCYGKAVLEGGCGKGRHTHRIARWGARDIVAVDLSDAVDLAFDSTRGIENAHVIQADIYHMPLRAAFDYAFSLGVLHHLPDPRAGFMSLAAKVKPGGHVSAWIYGAENNGWIVRFINPVREYLTSRMNPRFLFHLSKFPAAIMYAVTKLSYGPLNRSRWGKDLARHLFYNDYLSFVSAF